MPRIEVPQFCRSSFITKLTCLYRLDKGLLAALGLFVQYSAYWGSRGGGGGRWGRVLGAVIFHEGTYWCYWKPLCGGEEYCEWVSAAD